MPRRITTAVSALVLAGALVACGGGDTKPETTTPTPKTEEPQPEPKPEVKKPDLEVTGAKLPTCENVVWHTLAILINEGKLTVAMAESRKAEGVKNCLKKVPPIKDMKCIMAARDWNRIESCRAFSRRAPDKKPDGDAKPDSK